MRFREKITGSQYKQIAKRSLRLFLSADIVNSTALKQEFRNRPGESWIELAHGFYTSFPSEFAAESARVEPTDGSVIATVPELWKALGDELIFVAEVRQMADIPAILNAFRRRIQVWNHKFEGKRVFIKGAAWLAGFPVMNSAIIGDETDHLDFIGLSMDVGFRLCHQASSRRFVLGVELAYVLAVLGSELFFEMQYSGKEILKGVLRDRPYPILWLDCFVAETLPQFAELEVLEEQAFHLPQVKMRCEDVAVFLLKWMEATRGDICPPFCPDDQDNRFPIQVDYASQEEAALAELEREFLEVPSVSFDEGKDEEQKIEDVDGYFKLFDPN
jgi:hypothetical protein